MRGKAAQFVCSAVAVLIVTATPSAALAGSGRACPVLHWGTFTEARGIQATMLSPTAVSIRSSSPVIQVGSSNSTEYALLANGTLWAWGLGKYGQLGNGATENSLSTAVRVRFPAGISIAAIPVNSMPFDTALAVDTHGHVWGWGRNDGGPLCLGNMRSHDRPVELPFTDVTELAGAAEHAFYDAGGVLYSCGLDSSGVLGAGPHAPRDALTPVRVKNLNGNKVTALVSSWQNGGALLGSGQYYDWGYNEQGQLGDGGTTHSSVPVLVSLPSQSPVVGAAQGGSLANNGQTLVRLADGAVYGWGDNSYRQLDASGPAIQLTPQHIHPPAGVSYRTMASGGGTTYAITTPGDVYARGWNRYGQIGDGTTTDAPKPVLVASGVSLISSTAKNVVVGC